MYDYEEFDAEHHLQQEEDLLNEAGELMSQGKTHLASKLFSKVYSPASEEYEKKGTYYVNGHTYQTLSAFGHSNASDIGYKLTANGYAHIRVKNENSDTYPIIQAYRVRDLNNHFNVVPQGVQKWIKATLKTLEESYNEIQKERDLDDNVAYDDWDHLSNDIILESLKKAFGEPEVSYFHDLFRLYKVDGISLILREIDSSFYQTQSLLLCTLGKPYLPRENEYFIETTPEKHKRPLTREFVERRDDLSFLD